MLKIDESEFKFKSVNTYTYWSYIEDDDSWYAESIVTLRRRKTVEDPWEERVFRATARDEELEKAILHASLTTTTVIEEKGFKLFDEE